MAIETWVLLSFIAAAMACLLIGLVRVALAARALGQRDTPAAVEALNATMVRVNERVERAERSAASLDDLVMRANAAVSRIRASIGQVRATLEGARSSVASVRAEFARLARALRS